MSKIWKLFVNENIKTWKKLSTKILLIVILLALIGTLGFVKLMQNINSSSSNSSTEEALLSQTEKEIENINEALRNDNLDESTREEYMQQLERCELALEYNVVIYSDYWKAQIVNEIIQAKQLGIDTTELDTMLRKNDFSKYIDFERQKVEQELKNNEISQEEYDDKIFVLNLKEKCKIGESVDDPYWKTQCINQIENLQKSLRTGVDTRTSKALSPEDKQEYEDNIKIYQYRLENDFPELSYSENYRQIFELLAPSMVVAMIAITAMIIAGGAISTEVSTGSIKFWALTPNKRWKILTAKILSLFFYIIVITLIMVVLTIICSNMFFTEQGTEYIYVQDGVLKTIPNMLYIFEMYFAKIIPVVIFALFALMLSVLIRNTAVSVSFSVAIYIGNGIVMSIINQLIQKDWIRFVPFNNLNIADKIFVNADNPLAIMGSSFATSTSLQFSLTVLAVCAVLMLITTYDSFNHRDII